jgi:hypothetical protein
MSTTVVADSARVRVDTRFFGSAPAETFFHRPRSKSRRAHDVKDGLHRPSPLAHCFRPSWTNEYDVPWRGETQNQTR